MIFIFTLILFFLLLLFYYLALSQGTELPSSIILASFKRKKHQTLSELTNLFTDSGLINNRVDDLVAWKLVKRQGRELVLTNTGTLVWWVMEAYRWLFHRPGAE